MLESIHKFAQNPVFKILFAVIIFAFIISGVTGLNFGRNKDDFAATVGKEKITTQELETRFGQMIRSLGPQVLQMKEEQLAALGVSRQQVLKSLIQGALVRQEAKALGIEVGEESVKKQIIKMPVFSGEDGKFDPQRFKLFLEKMNMTEGQLQRDMKNDLRNLILASTIMNNTPKNVFVAQEIAKAIKVVRDIEVVKIPAGHIKIAAAPTDEELKTYYFENSFHYQTPETRDVSYINIPKPAADDKAGFDKITQIEDEIAGGSNLQEISTKLGYQVQQKKNVAQSEHKFNQIAFGAKKGQLSSVTLTDDDVYVVVQVDEIHERAAPELSTVKDKVIADWKVKKGTDENIKFSQGVVAELKEGKSLAAVAAEKGLSYEKLQNFSSDDKRYGDEFIVAVFNSGSGKLTNSIPDGNGGYIIAKVTALKQNPVTTEDTNQALTQGAEIFQEEIFSQYMKYLEKKYPVVINQNVFKAPAAAGAKAEDEAPAKAADKNADPA